MGNRDIVKLAYLIWWLTLEPDGAPIAIGAGLPINGLAHTEHWAIVPVEQTTLTGLVRVRDRIPGAQHFENCIVEALGPFDVAGPEHHVAEQRMSPEFMVDGLKRCRLWRLTFEVTPTV
jgi:hypothetical protein